MQSVTAPIQTVSVMVVSAKLVAAVGVGDRHHEEADGDGDENEVAHACLASWWSGVVKDLILGESRGDQELPGSHQEIVGVLSLNAWAVEPARRRARGTLHRT